MAHGALLIGFLALGLAAAPGAPAPGDAPRRILVFSKTAGFRHASIPDGIAAIRELGAGNGFDVDATEDDSVFEDATLSSYDAVVFLSTTGDILDPIGQAAFERYIRGNHGFVGIHSASDTEYGWAWYGELVGAFFANHPAIQSASVRVLDRLHPSTRPLPELWNRTDEWYNLASNPASRVHVLATVDESSYAGGSMGANHPISWCQFVLGGRSWYTAMGHTSESFAEPRFLQHLLGGIQFAAGFPDCQGRRRPRPLSPR
jgi:type 1 glutamine amidotransferase